MGVVTNRISGFTCAAIGGLLWLQREVRREIYQPPHPALPIVPPSGFQVLSTQGRHPVQVLYAPPPTSGAPTVVYFHGNASELGASYEIAEGFRHEGFGVAVVEYVGYGPNPSHKPSCQRIVSSCVDAMQMIHELPATQEVVLVGFSLGTVFATQMAARGFGSRLVLGAPFTSAASIMRNEAPYIPPWIVLGPEIRLDSLTVAPTIDIPVLVTHGDKDEQLPSKMGRELATAFPQGTFVAVPGIDHNGLVSYLPSAARAVCGDLNREIALIPSPAVAQ